MPYVHNTPKCPECKKRGIVSHMTVTKLEEIWHCKRCNYMTRKWGR